MQAQAVAVGHGRAAVHGDHRVVDLGLGHRDRLQHAEEGHGAGHVGEQVEVEAGATDGADDAAYLLLLDALGAQFLGQGLEALGNRLVQIGFQVHQVGDHHHHAVAVAEVFDVARALHEVEEFQGLLVHRGQERLVHQREVVGVGGVFQLDLPVAGEAETVLAGNLHAITGALLHEQVDPLLRRAEEVHQRLDVVLEGGEDHAVVLLDAQAHQGQFALVQAVGVAFRVRHAAQAAVQGVAPAVVGADEAVGLALLVLADGGATVAATVEQHVHVLLAVTHDDHRLLADVGALVAAGLGNLAGVGDPDPGAVEDLFQLFVEEAGVGVEGGVHAVVQHQVGRRAGQVHGFDQVGHDHSSSAQDADLQKKVIRRSCPELAGARRCSTPPPGG
ncbi:hypothetical protein D9M68_452270 [compost metagenome]